MQLSKDMPICDIGAGVGHLTRILSHHFEDITAVEPNDDMRTTGIQSVPSWVKWHEGTAEDTGLETRTYSLAAFGSSFNVTDRMQTPLEMHRMLQPSGWFMCLWNHRDLTDPIQQQIEACITKHIENYQYGTRRENQAVIIKECQSSIKTQCISKAA